MSTVEAEVIDKPIDTQQLDETGKTVFDDIYNAPDPRRYYHAMQSLDYRIPEEAKVFFKDLLNRYQQAHPQQKSLKALDLGSSYGVNAALLQWDLNLQNLYDHYGAKTPSDLNSKEWLALDRDYFGQFARNPALEIVGFDIAENALHYASQASILPQTILANLEENEVTPAQVERLQDIDCIISSGCIGYVTEISLQKILNACAPKKPWMSHCILRMFSLEPYEILFKTYGYQVKLEEKLLPQRRFASREEQEQVIARLQENDVDPSGYESEGWLYAQVLVATM